MPRTSSTTGVAAHPQLGAPCQLAGMPGLGSRAMSAGNVEWAQHAAAQERSAPQHAGQQDLSSIHMMSPSPPEKDEKEEILEHCRDTTKLVNQLTSALRNLELDVSNLKRENQSLRQTMFTALPPEQVQQLLQQAEAAVEMPQQGLPEPVSSGGFVSSGMSSPACDAGRPQVPGLCAQALMPPHQPLHSARHSTPPPTARLAQSAMSARERPAHASPHFGQTPGAWPSPLLPGTAGPGQQVRTPSPSGKRMVVGPALMRPGFAATDASQGCSPQTDSTATIVGMQDPSAAPVMAEAGHVRGSGPPAAVDPAENSAMQGSRSSRSAEVVGPWGVDQTFWLGPELAPQMAGKVRVLERDAALSVNAAAEGLNRGTFPCSDDVCVVFSTSNRGYFLLYRNGHRDKAGSLAATLASRPVEEVAHAAPPSRGDEAAGNAGCVSGGTTPTIPANLSLAGTPEPPSMLAPGLATDPSVQPQLGPTDLSLSQAAGPGPSTSSSRPPSRGSLSGTVLVQGPADKDPLCSIEELAVQGELGRAEELLSQLLRSGGQLNEACFDVLVAALDREGQHAKAHEWLRRASESGYAPCEASFNVVVTSLCQQGAVRQAEELIHQMMRLRVRPCKELFNTIIRVFSDQRNAPKVEEWLLNAGQSGWTPEQAAFEAVVLLYADLDASKAEEWLSRGQQTEYRLPDACYSAVVQAFLRQGNSSKVNEWLSRMLAEDRVPNDSLLREVIVLHIEAGDIPRAEAWLTQLAGRTTTSVESLRTALFDAAMQTGDVVYAERQVAALTQADAERTMKAASALIERKDFARAKTICERYRSLGGAPTLDICNTLLFACAATGDAEGAEVAARALASAEPLSESQVALLRRAAGAERASELLDQFGVSGAVPQPPPVPSEQPAAAAQQAADGPGLHRERSPATLPSLPLQHQAPPTKTSTERQGVGRKTTTPSSTSSRGTASKAASVASAKAQARRSPGSSPSGAGATRTRPMR